MSAPSYASTSASPLSLDDLARLQEVMLFGPDDVAALRKSREVLRPHVEEILDTWYGFVGSKPQLLQYFADSNSGAPDARYLAEVRKRFAGWIDDTARAEYDEEWLAYQHEIGLRHHTTNKNDTDGVDSIDIVHFRYLVALHVPVTATLRPFLERGDHSPEEVDAMHRAWEKSVLLQAILWSAPYVNDGEF
ncbi:MAG: protoglobin domain-containing protein [Planctomycetota bacterium]